VRTEICIYICKYIYIHSIFTYANFNGPLVQQQHHLEYSSTTLRHHCPRIPRGEREREGWIFEMDLRVLSYSRIVSSILTGSG